MHNYRVKGNTIPEARETKIGRHFYDQNADLTLPPTSVKVRTNIYDVFVRTILIKRYSVQPLVVGPVLGWLRTVDKTMDQSVNKIFHQFGLVT